jgi:Protein of unknown function (DUF4058)
VLKARLSEPIPHVSVEVRDKIERRLVTNIEILSPTNKRGVGKEEYAAKRSQILAGEAHLLEIDLLRVGARFPTMKPLPECPYFVFLSRVERRPHVEIWPIRLEEALPIVPVPLLTGDPDARLDLQQALSAAYETYKYDADCDYSRSPPGPLTPAEADWIDQRLRQASRRT